MDTHSPSRREFLGASALGALVATPALGALRQPEAPKKAPAGARPCVVSSANGLPATAKAMELIKQGYDCAEAVVRGVNIVEDDPNDDSVGYGGLPNEEGVVELDASVMHGPTGKAGCVASLRNIKNPASVALLVLRRTNHVLLVGEGALRFARAHGFEEQNLLTEASRKAWLTWKENHSAIDDWLSDEQRDDDKWAAPAKAKADATPASNRERSGDGFILPGVPYTTGTIHCAAVDANGNLGSVTTTSGLSYKIPGRVGDSPIIGAGNFTDNTVGSAGATGRGESCIQNAGAATIVRLMDSGLSPEEACLKAMKKVYDSTKEKRLLNAKGRPTFDLKFYALRKDGAFGCATMFKGGKMAVNDGASNRLVDGAFLFEGRD